MKRKMKWCTVVCCMLVILYSFSGCGATQEKENSTYDTVGAPQEKENSDYDTAGATLITAAGSGEDCAFGVDGTGARADGNIVTITEEGTYIVSGTMENGQIIVETDKGTAVQLVLNGADLHFEDGAAIYVANAGTITLTIAEGSVNTVSDSASYVYTDTTTDEQDAAIYSTDDLIVNGTGTLKVTGNYAHGIKAKDTMVIAEAALDITAKEDAVNANDTLEILSGTLTIAAGDDGIHTDMQLTIDSGSIAITECTEGLEGSQITVNGGTISIISSDDAINAANSEGSNFDLDINGGEITILTGGDGLDSNGTIEMAGGTVLISGPTNSANGSVDYEYSFDMSGGTLVATGASGMAETASSTSGQPSIMVYYVNTMEAGTVITLTDSEGNPVVTMTPETSYQCALISAPGLVQGETYELYSDGEKLCDITISDVVTLISSDGSEATGGYGMGGFGGGNMGGQGGGRGEFGGQGDRGDFDGQRPAQGEMPEMSEMPEMPGGTM